MTATLPIALRQHPELDQWIAVRPGRRISVMSGKVEIGQGIKTALALIVAEELDVSPSRIDVQTAATGCTPDEGVTSGSVSVEGSGGALRIAAATARGQLLDSARRVLDVPLDSLRVEDGIVKSTRSNLNTDYWSLQSDKPFAVRMTRLVSVKDPDRYKYVGGTASRVDLPGKLLGRTAFVHDLRMPSMRHARVVRAPSPGAELVALHLDDFEAVNDVRVVRDGSFLAVISVHEEKAIRAATLLSNRCRWRTSPLPPADTLHADLRKQVKAKHRVVDGTPVIEECKFRGPAQDAHTTIAASYARPYQMHASLGPSAALAHFCDARLTVWTHSQGIEMLRRCLAGVLPVAIDQIHLVHREGAGCYGHNGADDAALDAALVAIAVPDIPILLQWSRADEHRFEPYAPAMTVDLQASLSERGRILDWRHTVTSFSHGGRPLAQKDSSGLLAAWSLAAPVPATVRAANLSTEGGSHRNAEPIYALPKKYIAKHFSGAGPLRSSSVRSLGGFTNVFAIESFMDELAAAADVDALEFRLSHLTDTRARGVLEKLSDELRPVTAGLGRGIALAQYKNRQCYAAVSVDLSVRDDGEIILGSVLIVADAGCVIDPDGARNQLEGAFIQAASWTLLEKVQFDESGVTSTDWDSYPILRFDRIPEIRTVLLERRNDTAVGVGEAMTGPTPGAIANAVYDAIGVRLREVPFTAAVVLDAARDS